MDYSADVMEFWLPAIENVRSRGVPMDDLNIIPILQETKYLTLLPVWIGTDDQLADRMLNKFMMPMVIDGHFPFEYKDLKWHDGYELIPDIPGVLGTPNFDHPHLKSHYCNGVSVYMWEDMVIYPYWQCLPLLTEEQVLAAHSLHITACDMLTNETVLDEYEFLTHLYESGSADPEWVYNVLNSDNPTEEDMRMIDQLIEWEGEEYAILVASVWESAVDVIDGPGIHTQVRTLDELVSTEMQASLLQSLRRQMITHAQPYLRSIHNDLNRRWQFHRIEGAME